MIRSFTLSLFIFFGLATALAQAASSISFNFQSNTVNAYNNGVGMTSVDTGLMFISGSILPAGSIVTKTDQNGVRTDREMAAGDIRFLIHRRAPARQLHTITVKKTSSFYQAFLVALQSPSRILYIGLNCPGASLPANRSADQFDYQVVDEMDIVLSGNSGCKVDVTFKQYP